MSSQYMDEKHPDIVYQVVPVLESVEVRQPRPLWRRFIRIFMTIIGVSMIWSAVAPSVHYSCHHGHKNRHSDVHNPTSEVADPNVPKQHFTFDSSLDHFYVKQESFSAVPTRTEVVGTIYVASCSKAKNISAHFKLDATDDDILHGVTFDVKHDGIIIKADPFSLVKQTVNVTGYIVLPIADDYKFKKLLVKTIQLPVVFTESFATAINGTLVETVSGNVHVHGKDDKLEDVNNLKIKTVSGNISGYFRVSHALALETTSGDIEASLYSQNRPEEKAWLKTENVSGNSTVIFAGDLHPRPLYSKHTSVSGDVNVSYPEDWQGGLKVETTTGKLAVHGKGTKIVKKEKDVTKKLWEVVKGYGKSKGYVGTLNGNVNIQIGDDE